MITIETKLTQGEFDEICEYIGADIYSDNDVKREYNAWRDDWFSQEGLDEFLDEFFMEVKIGTGKLFVIDNMYYDYFIDPDDILEELKGGD